MVDAWGHDERDDDPLARLERLVNARTHRMTGAPARTPASAARPDTMSGSLRGAIDDLYGTSARAGSAERASSSERTNSAERLDRAPAVNAAASRMPELPVMNEPMGAPIRAPASRAGAASSGQSITDLDAALDRVPHETAAPADLEPLDLPPLDLEAELALDPVFDATLDPALDRPSEPPLAPVAELPPSLAALRGDWPGMAPMSAPGPAPEMLPPVLDAADPLPRFLRQGDGATPTDDPAGDLDAQFDAALDAEMGAGLNDAVSGALAAATAALAATSTQRPSDRPAAIEPLAVPAPPAYTASEELATAPIEFGDDFERELVDELLQIELPVGAPAAMPDDPLVAPVAMAYADPDEDERPAPANDNAGRRRGAMVAAMLAGVAVIGGLAAHSLGGGVEGPTEVALIRADPTPARVRPAEPGGRTVPNQSNAVYERVAKVEKAQARATGTPIAPPALVDKTEDVSTIREPVVSAARDAVRSDAVDVSPRDVYAPRAVRTIQVGPDGTIASDEPVRAPVAAPTPSVTADAPADTASNPVVAAIEGTPAPGMPLPRFRPAGLATAAPAPVQVASAAPASDPVAQAAAPAAPGGYVVQIASVPSADAARRTYGQLASRFGSVIGGRGVDYQVANIPGKGTFHRVRIPASSKADASATCAALKGAGGSCFVTR